MTLAREIAEFSGCTPDDFNYAINPVPCGTECFCWATADRWIAARANLGAIADAN